MTVLEKILDTLWNYNDAAKSEALFKDLFSNEIGNQAEILTQIARAQGLQGKFDEAHKTLNEVERLEKDGRIQVRYLLERGRVYNSSKQGDKATSLFLEAYALGKSIGADFYTIDAAHMMAIAETSNQQLSWHETALELCETTTDDHAKKWLGSVTNNAAWTYHDLGRYEEALETFQKALAWHKQQGKPETIRIAKWSVARCLRSLGGYQEALEIQKRILAECEAGFIQDGYVYEELGECLLALDQENKAKPYFEKAHEFLTQDSWFVKNENVRLQRLKDLGFS